MNRKEFVRRVSDSLKDRGIRKEVKFPEHILRLSDGDKINKKITVPRITQTPYYTVKDVDAILGACLQEIERAMCNGEEVSFFGYCTLGVHRRAARSTKIPGTNQYVEVAERMSPKAYFGKYLRMAARVYEKTMEEKDQTPFHIQSLEDDEADDDMIDEEDVSVDVSEAGEADGNGA